MNTPTFDREPIYSPPPKEYPAEIRATNQEESTENRIRAIRTQFEIED